MQRPNPDNQNNLLLAVVLSMAALFGWQMFYAEPRIQAERQRLEQIKKQEKEQQAKQPGAESGDAGKTATLEAPKSAQPAMALTRADALALSPRIQIETPSLTGSIALKGGRIDDLHLVKYHDTVDPKSPNVVLFSPGEFKNAYFAEYGWLAAPGSQVKTPDRESLWQVEGNSTLSPTSPVTLVWDNGQGVIFRRTISVDADYMFKIVDAFENKTDAPVTLVPYARVSRYGVPKVQGYWILHEGFVGVLGEKGLEELTYAHALDADGPTVVDNAVGGWLGFTDKYWAATLIPDQTAHYDANLSTVKPRVPGDVDEYHASYRLSAITAAPGESKSISAHLYAGAKEVKLIEGYEKSLGINKFELMIDWGWFYFITKPMYFLMEAINGVVKNFGVTILLLTVLVKLAFFPLANKSYESMAKMKKLQPEIEKLRARFKDDMPRQQQEMMALYKKEKVNPLAGCLPILLQIPVFFALYKVLFVTIDMRHAPFFGWIKDLSAPDPTSLFNLFGLLPFAVPEFLHVGVWPLIMGLTMWFQMQLNPQQPDPIQQQIFNWMPVLFTFLLAAFPAGLVIYWAWSNTLSIAQQSVILKRQGAPIPIMDNLRRKWATLSGLFSRRTDTQS
jgi:YidC/Oxa1 family membrane protein insertase